jgi:hypothetical protein
MRRPSRLISNTSLPAVRVRGCDPRSTMNSTSGPGGHKRSPSWLRGRIECDDAAAADRHFMRIDKTHRFLCPGFRHSHPTVFRAPYACTERPPDWRDPRAPQPRTSIEGDMCQAEGLLHRLTVVDAMTHCAATPFDGLSTAFCFLYSLVETNSSEQERNYAAFGRGQFTSWSPSGSAVIKNAGSSRHDCIECHLGRGRGDSPSRSG